MDTSTKIDGRGKGFRWLALIVVALFGVALTIGSGGGGGGDEDDDVSDVGILGIYEFLIGGPLAGNAGQSQIDILFEGVFELNVQPTITGSIVCDQVTEECGLQTVWEDSTVLIDDRGDPGLVDDFNVIITDLWILNPDDADADPTTGGILVESLNPELADVIVQATECGPGVRGVRVTTNPPSTNNCYAWEAFYSLLDDFETATAVELRAVLGWGAISLMLEQTAFGFEIFPLLDDVTFAAGSPTAQCDMYSSAWPGGPPNPGTTTLTWFDDNPNGLVGPGDSFRQEFNECWLDIPGNDIDELLNGIIDFVSYTEVVDPAREVITRIGFEGATLNARTGGIGYGDELGVSSLTNTETLDSGGKITIDSEITLTGKYVLVFYE